MPKSEKLPPSGIPEHEPSNWTIWRLFWRLGLRLLYLLLGILAYSVILGYGVAGGVAAAATFAHMEGLPYSGEILENGAIGGLVFSAIYHIQIIVAAVLGSHVKTNLMDGTPKNALLSGTILAHLFLRHTNPPSFAAFQLGNPFW